MLDLGTRANARGLSAEDKSAVDKKLYSQLSLEEMEGLYRVYREVPGKKLSKKNFGYFFSRTQDFEMFGYEPEGYYRLAAAGASDAE